MYVNLTYYSYLTNKKYLFIYITLMSNIFLLFLHQLLITAFPYSSFRMSLFYQFLLSYSPLTKIHLEQLSQYTRHTIKMTKKINAFTNMYLFHSEFLMIKNLNKIKNIPPRVFPIPTCSVPSC